jgi:hypothetical protein
MTNETQRPTRRRITRPTALLAIAALVLIVAATAVLYAKGCTLHGCSTLALGGMPLIQVFGYNTSQANGPALTDPSYVKMVKDDHAHIFRFPGGTLANYWDWRKGRLLTGIDLPDNMAKTAVKTKNLPPATLESLKQLADSTGIIPCFVLNILTSTLDDQLEMLKTASSLGLPVKYVELGNEIYWGKHSNVYPTAADYAKTAAEWAHAIKVSFPEAKIAIIGDSEDPDFKVGERVATWNTQIRPFVEGNTDLDAVTMHPYIFKSSSYPEISDLSQENIQRTFAASFLARNNVTHAIDHSLPPGKEVWITEYNIIDDEHVVNSRWIHTLFSTSMTLSFLDEPRISMMLFHSLSGAYTFAVSHHPTYAKIFNDEYHKQMVPYSLTAAGVGVTQVFGALEGMEEYKKIEFPDSQQYSVQMHGKTYTYPGLVGYTFGAGSLRKSVILNLSDTPVKLDLGDASLSSNRRWRQYTADPAEVVADVTKDVTVREGKAAKGAELAPYSLNVLE